METRRNQSRSQIPNDVLVPWDDYTSPYGTNFSPSLIYEDILSILTRYNNITKLLELSKLGAEYECPREQEIATLDTSHIHNLLSTHVKLFRSWIKKRDPVDAIITLRLSGEILQNNFSKIIEDTMSLAMAGRIPIIVCDNYHSVEADQPMGYGVVTWNEIPEIFFPAIIELAPLCLAGRCLVIPRGTSIETCVIEPGFVNFHYDFVSELDDMFGYNEYSISTFSPERTKNALHLLVPRPIIRSVGNNDHFYSIIDEHAENYLIYRSLISSLYNKISTAKTEKSINDAFLEFEAGIAEVEVKYKNLQRVLRWKGFSVAVGLATTLLCIANPDINEISKYFVGSATIWQGFEYLRAIKDINEEMKLSRYWLPWYTRRIFQKVMNEEY